MTRKDSCIRRSLSLCDAFNIELANLLLFTQPSAVSVTAAICEIFRQDCSFDSFWISLVASLERIRHGGITGVAQTRKHFLTFEGTATDSESSLHSTYIHATTLPPKMFTRPRQDANDSLFLLRPWCNGIRVRTRLNRAQEEERSQFLLVHKKFSRLPSTLFNRYVLDSNYRVPIYHRFVSQ